LWRSSQTQEGKILSRSSEDESVIREIIATLDPNNFNFKTKGKGSFDKSLDKKLTFFDARPYLNALAQRVI